MALTTTSATSAVPARSGRVGLFQRMSLALQHQQEQARITGELMQMTTRELADLGLSPADIPDVARGTFRRG